MLGLSIRPTVELSTASAIIQRAITCFTSRLVIITCVLGVPRPELGRAQRIGLLGTRQYELRISKLAETANVFCALLFRRDRKSRRNAVKSQFKMLCCGREVLIGILTFFFILFYFFIQHAIQINPQYSRHC